MENAFLPAWQRSVAEYGGESGNYVAAKISRLDADHHLDFVRYKGWRIYFEILTRHPVSFQAAEQSTYESGIYELIALPVDRQENSAPTAGPAKSGRGALNIGGADLCL